MPRLSALGGLRLTDPSSGVGGPRQAAVLAVLLANRGRPVRVEQLIDEVWGPSPPPAVRKALRGYVSRLRRLLHAAATIESRSGAYRLDIAIDTFDVDRFVELGEQARVAAGPTAVSLLAEALRLIGSAEPYDGINAPSVNRERVWLNELRVSCLVRHAELLLESGQRATVLPELQRAAADNPLVEKLAVLLMSALYQDGRQAEALEVYRDLRHRLVEQLGLEPSPEARELELRILRQTVPTAVPAPSRSAPVVRAVTPFVGRNAELKTLEHAWRQIRASSRAGDRAAVMVSGDAGIGKTTLCAEFGRLVAEDGATVLYGRCDEGFAGPYQALVEPVRALVHRLAPSTLAAMPGVQELSRLVPLPPSVTGERLPVRADPAAERWMLFEAVAELLTLAGSEGPLVLVLDDLHWAEQSTLLLIRHLLRADRPLRLLLIGTYREAEPDRSEPLLDLLADMHRDDQAVRLTIGGFDETDTQRLIEVSTPGATFDSGLPNKLMTVTGGNPFFAREMLRHLIDGGRLDGAAVRALAGDGRGLPVSIQEILSRRTARLPEPARRVLALVATVGGEVPFTLLEAMATSDGIESGALIDALDVAVERRLLTETGAATYAFPHALVRQAVLDELTGARRRHLHRRALEGLIAIRSTDLEALARHSLDAIPLIPIAPAVHHAIAAARQLSERAAHETAAERLEQTLSVVEAHSPLSAELRCDLLLELAVLHRLLKRSHDASYALRAAADARELGSLERLIRAAEAYPQSTTTMEDDERRLVDEVVALSAVAPGPAVLRSRALILQADLEARSGRRDVALEAADEALALAQADGNSATRLEAIAVKGFALLGTERMDEILDLRRLAQAEVTAGPTPRGIPSLIVRRALVDLAAGDRVGFDRNRLEVEREWGQTRAADIGAAALNTRIVHARLEGRWDDALVAADRYLEENPDDPDAHQVWAAHQIGIHREIGRTADLVALVESMIAADPGLGHFRLGLAAPYLDSGRFEDAAQIVGELARPGLPDLPRDATFLLRLSVLAEAAAVVGDPTEVGIVWSALRPYSGMISSPDASYLLHGTVDRYLGMLAIRRGASQEAEQWFHRALETEQKLNAPPLEARTRLGLGRLLLSREASADVDRGRRHLDRSLRIASDLGMPVVADEIRALGAAGRAA